jgi:hypothetical protein
MVSIDCIYYIATLNQQKHKLWRMRREQTGDCSLFLCPNTILYPFILYYGDLIAHYEDSDAGREDLYFFYECL